MEYVKDIINSYQGQKAKQQLTLPRLRVTTNIKKQQNRTA